MTALDTSVVVPAIATWHEAHETARHAARGASIPAHSLLESYAVLTRLPVPHRLDSGIVESLLSERFPPSLVLAPPARLARSIVRLLASERIEGGAVYDGLVGLTAAAYDQELLTRDERAVVTYEALGVEFRLVT